jgi:hypothetical protein
MAPARGGQEDRGAREEPRRARASSDDDRHSTDASFGRFLPLSGYASSSGEVSAWARSRALPAKVCGDIGVHEVADHARAAQAGNLQGRREVPKPASRGKSGQQQVVRIDLEPVATGILGAHPLMPRRLAFGGRAVQGRQEARRQLKASNPVPTRIALWRPCRRPRRAILLLGLGEEHVQGGVAVLVGLAREADHPRLASSSYCSGV